MQLPLVQIEIRPANPAEAARLREVLPRSFQEATVPTLSVAAVGKVGRMVAASAVIPPRETAENDARIAWLRWRVLAEGFRREEVLKSLFAAALASARALRATALCSAGMIVESEIEASILHALGFEAGEAREVFEADPRAARERLESVYQRLNVRGLIPADARVEYLRDEFLPAARQLFARNLPEAKADQPLLAGEKEGYRQRDSFVLLQGNEVRGLLLARREGNVSHAGVLVVAAALRGGTGWANLLLNYHSNREAIRWGVEAVQFTADPAEHTRTLDFARLWGARSLGRKASFQRQL